MEESNAIYIYDIALFHVYTWVYRHTYEQHPKRIITPCVPLTQMGNNWLILDLGKIRLAFGIALKPDVWCVFSVWCCVCFGDWLFHLGFRRVSTIKTICNLSLSLKKIVEPSSVNDTFCNMWVICEHIWCRCLCVVMGYGFWASQFENWWRWRNRLLMLTYEFVCVHKNNERVLRCWPRLNSFFSRFIIQILTVKLECLITWKFPLSTQHITQILCS